MSVPALQAHTEKALDFPFPLLLRHTNLLLLDGLFFERCGSFDVVESMLPANSRSYCEFSNFHLCESSFCPNVKG